MLGKQPGLSRGAEAGGWSRGVPGSLPAERDTRQQAEPPGRSCPAHVTSQNNFPLPASLLNPLGASPTASTEGGERGLGCWNYRINFSASESKHLPGSRRQPGCQDPPAPGITGRGNRVQRLLRDCGHRSWVVCRTRSLQEGKGCPAEPGRSHRANCPAGGKSKVLALEQRGRTDPFPLGSWLRTHQLSCGCQAGREGEEEHQLTARGARSPHVQVPVRVRCRSHPRTTAGAGRRRRKAGRKGRSTRQPGCSSSCSDPFTTSGSSRQ